MELLTKLVDWWVITMTADNIGKWGAGLLAIFVAINTILASLKTFGPPSWRAASSKEMADNTVATNKTADKVEKVESAVKDQDLKATVAVQVAKKSDERSIAAETRVAASEKAHNDTSKVVIDAIAEVKDALKDQIVAANGTLTKSNAAHEEAGFQRGVSETVVKNTQRITTIEKEVADIKIAIKEVRDGQGDIKKELTTAIHAAVGSVVLALKPSATVPGSISETG